MSVAPEKTRPRHMLKVTSLSSVCMSRPRSSPGRVRARARARARARVRVRVRVRV